MNETLTITTANIDKIITSFRENPIKEETYNLLLVGENLRGIPEKMKDTRELPSDTIVIYSHYAPKETN